MRSARTRARGLGGSSKRAGSGSRMHQARCLLASPQSRRVTAHQPGCPSTFRAGIGKRDCSMTTMMCSRCCAHVMNRVRASVLGRDAGPPRPAAYPSLTAAAAAAAAQQQQQQQQQQHSTAAAQRSGGGTQHSERSTAERRPTAPRRPGFSHAWCCGRARRRDVARVPPRLSLRRAGRARPRGVALGQTTTGK